MDIRERLKTLISEKCILKGDFLLASGARSSVYFDCKRATLHPEGISLIGELLWEQIAALPGGVSAVGGPTIGADPIVGHLAALSFIKGQPVAAFLVRKDAKSHGTRRLIENPPPAGSRVAIFEDVVTSGGSTLDAIRAAEESGLKIAAVFCLVDREQGGDKALSAYDYRPLFKKSEFALKFLLRAGNAGSRPGYCPL
jgi:orotate phosphoribosyltransferase